MSLKTIITATYGSSTYASTAKLQEVSCKAATAKNQVTFLNRCIRHQIIPRFLQIKSPFPSKRIKNITEEHKKKLLIATRNDAKTRYFKRSEESKQLTQILREQLSDEHFSTITRVTASSKEKKFLEVRTKLKNKFELLYEAKYKRPFTKTNENQTAVKNCVLDLAGDIPDDQRTILNLGPKFAVTPKTIPYMEIVTSTEVEALNLEKEGQHAKAELLRQEVKRILINEKQPRPNLTKEQLTTIKEIREDKDIDIYPYDKGNGFVRLKKEMAQSKMIEGIGETVILQKDPTKTHLDKIQKLLARIRQEVNMPSDLYYKLYPSDAIVPRAYGQCKAHKPTKSYPFRVLVSTIGTAPYKVSKYLVKIIQPTLSKSPVVIKNAKAFVEEAKTWDISPNEIQVSYDVVALYPSVPVEKAILNLMEMLQKDFEDFKTRTILKLEHVKQLMEVCLYKSYFLWNKQIHSLKDSGPIGLSLMVVLAESFLQMIENKSLIIARNPPITHKRYVDDSHDRFLTKDSSEEFLTILNAQDERVQFTAEYEIVTVETETEEGKSELNYLEVTTINNKRGKYDFKVFRKEAITNIQIKPESCHSDKIKEGVFKGFILRAKAICSKEYLNQEIDFIKQIFVENGYDEVKLDELIKETEVKKTKAKDTKEKRYTSLPWIPGLSQKLKKAFKRADCTISFKSPRNLESILTSKNKPEMPPNSQPGVYFVPTGCQRGYTGETKKQISTRNKEHEKAIFKGDTKNDALAGHQNICDCEIDLSKTKTIAVEPIWFRRKVREALEIRRLQTGPEEERGLNRDLGDYVTTNSWSSLFTKVNGMKSIPNFESMTSNEVNDISTREGDVTSNEVSTTRR